MSREQAREKALNTLRKMSLDSLVEQFELTENMNGVEVAEVRGWLMEAIEEKNPDGFNTWLEMEIPEDSDLRGCVLG